jgi:hypothetical protein
MKKKQIQGLDLVLVAVSLALVVALIGAVCYVVLLSDEAFKSSPNEVEALPPTPAIPPCSDEQALTEEEKSEAIDLAINDPEVKKWLDEEYEIQSIGVDYWESSHKGKSSFHAYPAVSINVNPDPRLAGIIANIYVDLESKEVVEIMSIPRKRAPPLQATPVSQEQAKEIAESKFNEVKAQTEPVECEELWKNPKAIKGVFGLL